MNKEPNYKGKSLGRIAGQEIFMIKKFSLLQEIEDEQLDIFMEMENEE